jgi:hypothetical protein
MTPPGVPSQFWVDWSDQKIMWGAIETIDPLKVTARIRPIVIVGWEGDGWLSG